MVLTHLESIGKKLTLVSYSKWSLVIIVMHVINDVMLRKHNEVLLCEILYDEMGYDPGWLDQSEDWVVWLNEV